MDLWQLKVFVSVVDQKSFSKAGEAVFLSQPTVSSHIKELEEHFKCRLIDRLGREAIPTKAGAILYDYAKQLLSLKDKTESGISAFLGNAQGNLTIGASSIPSTYIIPKIIGRFTKQYPQISLSVMTGDTSEIVEAIANGGVEAGIVGAEIKDNTLLKQEKLIDDEMRLIVPASHRWADKASIDIESLLKEPFIGRERGSGTWASIAKSIASCNTISNSNAKTDSHGIKYACEDLNISVRFGSNASVIQGILHGAGVSIISTIAVQDYIDAGRLKALSVNGLNLKRHFFLTTHKKRTISPLATVFIKFIQSELIL
ncbi:MAG: LysR family transcriptional regulator [Desulfamplus sp.]|nr:LysR family transcriptional regulator [Desulfamplus sp.]MBF0412881.1 LysR family transcriptional regulator [Desulfamplus sp.]